MILREDIEKREFLILSKYAAKASESRGRVLSEKKCDVRTEFQRDRDRIVHSKAFRRLMHKTQVFLAPEGDHYRTRLTHTLEVSQISRTVARALALNEDLTEAIALGHDLGHTPFGHNGESVLNEIHPGGFEHNRQSLRVVEILEGNDGPGGRGLNLTLEVRDGIVNHTGSELPMTLEGQIVKICDRVAYINHDIDDALRSGVIAPEDLPQNCIRILGDRHSGRINTLVTDLIHQSDGKDKICMSDECKSCMDELRAYMFENVYHNSRVKKEEDLYRVKSVIEGLYDYYITYPEQMPADIQKLIPEWGIKEAVKDYVAGMTDRYAMSVYSELFVPKGWK